MIRNAAANKAAGAVSTKAKPATRQSKFNTMSRLSIGKKSTAKTKAIRPSANATKPKKVVASNLPPMICQRGKGLINSGSSERRSRSPAVVSVAMCMLPTNAMIKMKYGRNDSIWPPRASGVAWSSMPI